MGVIVDDEAAWAEVCLGQQVIWPELVRPAPGSPRTGTTGQRPGGELPTKQIRRLARRDDVLLLRLAGPRSVLADVGGAAVNR